MTNTINSPDQPTGRVEKLDCYTGLYSARAEVLEPTDVDELRGIFAAARAAGRRITLRAGAHSFDGQALGDDLVVSMLRMNAIEVMPEQRRMQVGPGATWGAIVERLQPLGLVPAVTVTTEHATAGGTLSGDCLSRFSPSQGKEGEWIESFDLLTTEGELLTCTPPARGSEPSTWTTEERAFCGAIGGLGYLGAVVSIVYCLLPTKASDGKVGVRTLVRKFETFADLAADLVPTTRRTHLENSDADDPEKLDAIWSALGPRRRGAPPILLFFTSTYTASSERRRLALHQPKLLLRILVEWLMRVSFISTFIWHFFFRLVFRDGEEYIDDLEGFAFFMDGNARSKHAGRKLGFSMRNIQQSFVIPSDVGAEGGWDRAKDDLVEWLEFAHDYLLERNLTPTLNDVLFLPQDLPFLLSASADRAGFVVSYAFETSNRRTLQRAEAAFSDLADVLWDKFQGRVYLVKNVFAKPETLVKMYGEHAIEFVRLKQQLDPQALLRNDFLERTFGELL